LVRTIIVDDPVIARLVRHLARAARLGHSGKSFLEHLLCTWRILADWGMPAAVCRAGFMHSAYSTAFYPHALFTLEEREAVRGMVGREAEDLVYRFCMMDRRGFWEELAAHPRLRAVSYPDRLRGGAPVRVSRRTMQRLLMIESANIAEQSKARDGGPAPWMSRLLPWWAFLELKSLPLRLSRRPSLTTRAEEAAIECYREALTMPSPRTAGLLERSIRQNPWAAEPRIMLALWVLENGDGKARRSLQEGIRLLREWATPWDKRMTVDGWLALAERIQAVAAARRVSPLRFAAICEALEKKAPMPRWLRV
jgi:hypothetical protein